MTRPRRSRFCLRYGTPLVSTEIASGAKGVVFMKNIRFSRREFLQTTAGAVGATFAAGTTLLDSEPLYASSQPVSPSDRVRFGIVGVGMEGTNLLSTAI